MQADVSLLGAAACTGSSPTGLTGAYTLDEALGRLLAGAPCTWRLVAPRAVQILPAQPPGDREKAVAAPAVAELLVTATKRLQRADRLAAAVSVISAEQLLLTRAVDPGETTGQLAGVLTTNLGPGRDKFLLRGLSDGAFTGRAHSTVGTYLDESPINYNAPDPDLRLVDVERVEVIRGPQGALYGAGSLSGVYRIVTRKPDLDRVEAGIGVSQAWTLGGAPSQDVEGFANLPIMRGAIGLRAAAYHEVQGGYLDDVNLQRNNVDRTLRDGGRLSLRLQPNEDWTIDLSGAIQRLKSNDTQYTTPSMGLTRANRVAEAHDNDIRLVTATVRGWWGWGELTSSTGYVRHAYSSIYDASAAADLFNPKPSELGVYAEQTRTEMLVQDFVLTSRSGGRFGWLAGLYASDMLEDSPSTLKAGVAGAPLETVYRQARHDRIRDLALYGEASYEVAPGWTLALGARVFDTRVRTTSDVASERGPPRTLVQSAEFSGISPKISLQRQFASGDLIYAVISEGYRAGGINSGGARPLPASRSTFGPDRLLNYEVGAKLRAFDRRLVTRSALFYDLWTNIQTDQFRPSGIPYTANVGDARIAGLEIEVSYAWDMGLSVQANALLSDTRITRTNPDYSQRLTNGLPGAPRASGGILVIYQRPLFGDTSLRLVAEANYVGRSRVTFDPALAPEMGGYVREKLAAELAGRGWTAQVFVTNPGNTFNDTFSYGNPFSFGQVRQITPQRPRTIGVAMSATF